MLLKNTISLTKKILSRTIQGLKSFMSNGVDCYHKLPKSNDMNYKELDKLYIDFPARCVDKPYTEIKEETSLSITVEQEQVATKKSSTGDTFLGTPQKRASLVAEKLKEMAMTDVRDVEHGLDIEEVLHYYSRLTCSPYIEIVDKFVIDMCSEFIDRPPSPTHEKTRTRIRKRYR